MHHAFINIKKSGNILCKLHLQDQNRSKLLGKIAQVKRDTLADEANMKFETKLVEVQ